MPQRGSSGAIPRMFSLPPWSPGRACRGFSYLGGSTLLPWHGTGCLDNRGLVCAEFLVSLDHRDFLPVYSNLLSDRQPLLMVPSTWVKFAQGRRRVDPHLLATARLRPR
jgi:hypothetical protein